VKHRDADASDKYLTQNYAATMESLSKRDREAREELRARTASESLRLADLPARSTAPMPGQIVVTVTKPSSSAKLGISLTHSAEGAVIKSLAQNGLLIGTSLENGDIVTAVGVEATTNPAMPGHRTDVRTVELLKAATGTFTITAIATIRPSGASDNKRPHPPKYGPVFRPYYSSCLRVLKINAHAHVAGIRRQGVVLHARQGEVNFSGC
jgi:hypothetical protein